MTREEAVEAIIATARPGIMAVTFASVAAALANEGNKIVKDDQR